MGQEKLTLRQLITIGLRQIAREVKSLKLEIQKMSNLPVISPQEIDMLKLQVASLSESLHDLEIRVEGLEKHSNVATEITRQAFTVFLLVLVLIAWRVFS